MKKLVSLMLSLLLLLSVASAETREGVIYLEGEPEPIVETLYESPLGFSFWYDAELLTVDEGMSEDGASLIVQPVDSDLPVFLEIMVPEDPSVFPEAFLGEAGDAERSYGQTDESREIVWASGAAPFNGSILLGWNVVDTGAGYVTVYTSCPWEAAEGYGKYLDRLICTISAAKARPVSVCFFEDMPDGTEYDRVNVSDEEPQVLVTFLASEPVTDFKVLSLTFETVDDEGHAVFASEEVYVQDALSPDRALVVGMTFFGDIPNNGISFTDAEGVSHMYAVGESGFDGSVMLSEIS